MLSLMHTLILQKAPNWKIQCSKLKLITFSPPLQITYITASQAFLLFFDAEKVWAHHGAMEKMQIVIQEDLW